MPDLGRFTPLKQPGIHSMYIHRYFKHPSAANLRTLHRHRPVGNLLKSDYRDPIMQAKRHTAIYGIYSYLYLPRCAFPCRFLLGCGATAARQAIE